tara:strand:+ start:1824 stop:2978 length:1155 start_codon:yes stop_codon:yes gene_type:complete
MSNLLDSASLLITPTAYNAGEILSIEPSDGTGDLDFTRGSLATRVNEQGLIELIFLNNIPRIDYKGGVGHWLIESQSTNLLPYSQDFSNSAWVKSNATVTSNSVTSPDGGLNASTIVFTSGGYILESVLTTKIIGSIETASVFSTKDVSGTFLKFTSATAAGTDVETKENYPNGWYRYSVTRTFTEAQTSNTQIIITRANVGESFEIWGAQLEQWYLSSYIPTFSTMMTRIKDQINTLINTNLINPTEGAIYLELAANSNPNIKRVIALSDGTNTGRIVFQFTDAPNQLRVTVVNNGSIKFDYYHLLDSTLIFHKFAISYQSQKFKFFVDGTVVATDSTGNPSPGLNQLNFFNIGGGNQFYGKIKAIGLYKDILTNEELSCLTT